MIISRSIRLRMRSVSDKIVLTIKTHILCSLKFFENRAVYEIRWKHTVQWGRPQLTIPRMRFAYWITTATDTHSEYVILTVFLLQQWLHERALMLCYTYTACLVISRCCQHHNLQVFEW